MTVAIFALLSRVLGLLRSTLMASFYGATESQGFADCYAASFKLPDIVFNLIVAGLVSVVLVPYFSSFIKSDDDSKQRINEACTNIINIFFIALIFFNLILFVFTPYLVRNFLVPGWTDEVKLTMTITMTRILLLQVLFMSLSGVLSSYLNAIEKFFYYSLALITYNTGIIAGIVFFGKWMSIRGVAWGAVLGSFLQFAIQFAGAYHNGYRYNFKMPVINKEIGELFLIALPRVIAIGGEQFVRFQFVTLGSFLFTGSIFIFESAENFAMVPYGMIAVSISITAFPVMSKLFARNEPEKMLFSLFHSLRTTTYFMLFISVCMVIYRIQIIDLLIGYNRFNENDIRITAEALAYFMIGIPFLSLTIITVKYFYAQKIAVIPMIFSIIAAVVTIVTAQIMVPYLKVSALSLGRSAGYLVQFVLMLALIIFIAVRKKDHIRIPYDQIKQIINIIFAGLILLVCGYFIEKNINFHIAPKLDSLLEGCVGGVILTVLYFIITRLFKIEDTNRFVSIFYKKRDL